MKYSIFIFSLLLLLVSCEKDKFKTNKDPECPISDTVEEAYTQDAQNLYMRDIAENPTHPNRQNPFLDEISVRRYLTDIQSIYNLSLPQRDSVFERYDIHAFANYSLNTIAVKVDTGSVYVKRWVNGQPSLSPKLEKILKDYRFTTVNKAYNYPDYPWVTIISELNLNLLPIEEELASISFIHEAEISRNIGGAKNITVTRDKNKTFYNFSAGFGDCPSGCITQKHWVFVNYGGCDAGFVEEY